MTSAKHRNWLLRFLFPQPTPSFFLRLTLVAIAAWLFFSRVCKPAWIDGESMAPLYHTGDFVFCWLPFFHNRPPQHGDIVLVRYAGESVMLLKRVVAVEGEWINFTDGQIIVNGQPIAEAWGHIRPCDWNSAPVQVQPHCVFVVGDNRAMPLSEHVHGQVDISDIAGAPLRFP